MRPVTSLIDVRNTRGYRGRHRIPGRPAPVTAPPTSAPSGPDCRDRCARFRAGGPVPCLAVDRPHGCAAVQGLPAAA